MTKKGCSRIRLSYIFQDQINIVNKKASFYTYLLNLGSQLMFVTMFYKLIMILLSIRYRNFIGQQIYQIEMADEDKG